MNDCCNNTDEYNAPRFKRGYRTAGVKHMFVIHG